jgi:hypothetical protein
VQYIKYYEIAMFKEGGSERRISLNENWRFVHLKIGHNHLTYRHWYERELVDLAGRLAMISVNLSDDERTKYSGLITPIDAFVVESLRVSSPNDSEFLYSLLLIGARNLVRLNAIMETANDGQKIREEFCIATQYKLGQIKIGENYRRDEKTVLPLPEKK